MATVVGVLRVHGLSARAYAKIRPRRHCPLAARGKGHRHADDATLPWQLGRAARCETRFYLTAQTDKLALYEKLGFTAFGDEFQDGGMPHLAMKTY